MDRTIDVLIVEPGKNPCPSTIADNLETLQQIVGGPIEAGSYLPQRVMLICNGEGKNMGLPPNRPKPVVSDNSFKWAYSAAFSRRVMVLWGLITGSLLPL